MPTNVISVIEFRRLFFLHILPDDQVELEIKQIHVQKESLRI